MSRIFLCARLGRRHEMREIAAHLKTLDHEVVSSWVFEDTLDEELDDDEKGFAAMRNFNDVQRAQVVVLFGEKPGTLGAERGGRFCDFAASFNLASTVRRFVVGPRENIYGYWPGVVHVETTVQLVAALKPQGKRT